MADLHRFYQATECWSGVYREPPESNEPEQDPIVAQLAKRHRNQPADVEQQGERPVPYLSAVMLRGLVTNRFPMNAVAWASADYHKDTLPPSLLTQLKERANADHDGLVPESLKTFLSEPDQSSPVCATDPNLLVPNAPATWLETVLRQSILSEADIDQLYAYRGQLTSDQVVDILFRVDQSVSQDTMQRWYALLSDKHQQTLKTHPPWFDGSAQTMEAMHDVEDILRDLLPNALLSMPLTVPALNNVFFANGPSRSTLPAAQVDYWREEEGELCSHIESLGAIGPWGNDDAHPAQAIGSADNSNCSAPFPGCMVAPEKTEQIIGALCTSGIGAAGDRDHQQAELAALNAGARPPWAGRRPPTGSSSFCLSQTARDRCEIHILQNAEGWHPLAQRSQLASRCQAFFGSVDTKEIVNTGCLTSMISKKTQVSAFLLLSDDTVRRVAKIPALRSLTSLFHSRGFPKAEEDIPAFIQWDIWWRGEGGARTLDRKLLCAFSSMFHGRGLPDKKALQDYLQRDVWWQEKGKVRTLDRELLRVFSSMFNGRGLPDKKVVEDYLQLDVWWWGESKTRILDRGLLRAFSSMFCGRGLPNKQAVEDYLGLDIWWQGEGTTRVLDRELLRAFSSMFCCKGLPDKKTVEDYLGLHIWWQGEGQARSLDRELLRAFSSMFSSRGLPDKKAVEDYLGLDIWWQGEGSDTGIGSGATASVFLNVQRQGASR